MVGWADKKIGGWSFGGSELWSEAPDEEAASPVLGGGPSGEGGSLVPTDQKDPAKNLQPCVVLMLPQEEMGWGLAPEWKGPCSGTGALKVREMGVREMGMRELREGPASPPGQGPPSGSATPQY